MLPSSHAAPIIAAGNEPLYGSGLLADAFSEFISASSLLEASYRDLQREVRQLGFELAERNAALTRSLAENDRMRAALQQIIDSMPCGVLVLDTAGTIVMINPEGRSLLALGNAHVADLQTLSAVSRIDFESLQAESGDGTGDGSEDRLDRELCISSASGNRWLAIGNRKLSGMSASQESSGGRTILKSIWILRDITAGKLAEQEREAARSSMALAEVSTTLAHEIRNPLASMELFAGLIAEDPANTGQWVSHLRAGIRLLSGTVNNVLSLHGGANPHLAPVDLNACVQSGVEFVRPIAEQAGVSLSFAERDSQLTIQGNENLLRQVVLNLICNAIRHTPAGGKIETSTRRVPRHGDMRALVEIADTGRGIPDYLIDRIFEAGFSADGDTPGLGLAVCKRIMTSHGGEIRAFSRVDRGSTFQLEFSAL
jgi:two-component system sensor histidine kinase FlrB